MGNSTRPFPHKKALPLPEGPLPLEFCAESGRELGHFTPVFDPAPAVGLDPNINPEELQDREQQDGGRTPAEILADPEPSLKSTLLWLLSASSAVSARRPWTGASSGTGCPGAIYGRGTGMHLRPGRAVKYVKRETKSPGPP